MHRIKRFFSQQSKLFLTDFTELKGCGCKIPKNELLGYLEAFPQTKNEVFSTSPDCHVGRTTRGELFASSIDFFYPLVDDAFLQGQITTCNVLSDVYAVGATRAHHILAILALSTKMTEAQRREVAIEIMAGMDDKAREAGVIIAGGQTVLNPWVTTGGSVYAFFENDAHLIKNKHAKPGDVIVLTKPLGTQLAINFNQYFRKDEEKRRKLIEGGLSADKMESTAKRAFDEMSTLNLYAAREISLLNAEVKACTDVTGFGLRGHSDNLVQIQNEEVDFVFDKMPVLGGLHKFDGIVRDFKLKQGLNAETSGGLLVVISERGAHTLVENMRNKYGKEAWVAGSVKKGSRKTIISDKVEMFEV